MKIHQILHGYSEGHKLLACSITDLSSKDKKKLAVLSDWDEFTIPDGDSSYITCYPLPDSHYYAIAKTWYAQEMERPGCVWTHTLLFDCMDITEFLDLRLLYNLFQRPQAGDYSQYETPLEIDDANADVDDVETKIFDIPSLDYWLNELLYKKNPLVFSIEEQSVYYQMLILSVLSHLPKLLMYNYSFCSGTGRVRKYENEIFDFQFVNTFKGNTLRLSELVDEDSKIEGWCKYIANSIQANGDNVPRLVSRFSSDIGDSVDKYATVVIVYELLERLKEPGSQNIAKFKFVLRVMSEGFPAKEDGAFFKSVILSPAITKYFFDEKEFVYQMAVTEYSNSFDYDSFDFSGRTVNYLSSHSVSDYADVLDALIQKEEKSLYVELVCEKASVVYGDDDLDFLLKNHWPFYFDLIKRRPEALYGEYWINAEDNKFYLILKVFTQYLPEGFDEWNRLFNRVVESEIHIEKKALDEFSRHIDNLSGVILSRVNTDEIVGVNWIDYCKSRPLDIIRWLKSQNRVNESVVRVVLDSIEPESYLVVGTKSEDWKALLNVNVGVAIKLQYSVFLFVVSYRTDRMDTAFALYKKSFQPIYEATAKDKIGLYWHKISPYCPKPFLGLEWDKCDMLRKGFVERVLCENRGKDVARKFTTDKNINKKLFKAVSKRIHE